LVRTFTKFGEYLKLTFKHLNILGLSNYKTIVKRYLKDLQSQAKMIDYFSVGLK